MKKSLLLICSIVLVTTSTYAGLLESINPGVRSAVIFNEIVYAPYCINSDGFQTGVNIIPDNREWATDILVAFFDGAEPYSLKTFTVGPQGWTGFVQDLCEVPMRSPSVVVFISLGADNGLFWVTQFVFTPSGFSHIVTESR